MNTKTKPRVGDRAWVVSWCELPEGGEDMNDVIDKGRRFLALEEARAFAREVFPRSYIPCVEICPVEFTPYDEDDAASHPHVGFWEAASEGEGETYEGEEEAPASGPHGGHDLD